MLTTRSPVARTPLHHWHATHGARFADRDGWQVVTAYSNPEQEAEAARAGLGLADVSAFAKISLRGPGVPSLVPSLVGDSAARNPGDVAVVPDGAALACRLTEDHLLMLASVPKATGLSQRLAGLPSVAGVMQTDVTSALAGFWVMGLRLDEFLRRLTHLDVRPASLPVNSCAETALAGVEALLVRSAELAVPSLRIYVAWDLAEYVWERMMDAGRDGQITPVGLEALGLLGAPAEGPGSSDRRTLRAAPGG
jgi:sarcosine oxidase subunit alpha